MNNSSSSTAFLSFYLQPTTFLYFYLQRKVDNYYIDEDTTISAEIVAVEAVDELKACKIMEKNGLYDLEHSCSNHINYRFEYYPDLKISLNDDYSKIIFKDSYLFQTNKSATIIFKDKIFKIKYINETITLADIFTARLMAEAAGRFLIEI